MSEANEIIPTKEELLDALKASKQKPAEEKMPEQEQFTVVDPLAYEGVGTIPDEWKDEFDAYHSMLDRYNDTKARAEAISNQVETQDPDTWDGVIGEVLNTTFGINGITIFDDFEKFLGVDSLFEGYATTQEHVNDMLLMTGTSANAA